MDADLAIVGAGPAGMAAAIEAGRLGLKAVLLDEQPRVGGQIYRNIGQPSMANPRILGPDYYAGRTLADDVANSGCRYLSNTQVWQLDRDGRVYYSREGKAASIQVRQVMIANGAQERPFPIPGWTLPGVMTAGSAQILLKNPGLAADGAVFAGCGPLLYLVVWQYLQAGVKVKALLDTTPAANYRQALGALDGALRGAGYLWKGLKLLRDIRAAGIPFVRGVTELAACAEDGVLSRVTYKAGGRQQHLETEQLFLHQGVVPSVNLAMASGCEHEWSEQQLCWQPVLDDWGQSSQPHIRIIGDSGGIGGALAAALKGRLAVLQLAHTLGRQTSAERDDSASPHRRQLKRETAFRRFIDRLYRPSDALRLPEKDEVLVCRCEEVSLGDIRRAVHQGCMGPNQLKSFTRCGMGPCQGRQCGLVVSELMAKLQGQAVEQGGYYRLRAPVKPLTLNELASLDEPSEPVKDRPA
ncbi:FAD/NAD(P)-dependent oxidoreductase [Oceanisphaera ostreae]|uniref:NAD(P)/FAD-dependent oxidoreductase n=1 Tax=Oceanisphaera ostreae TaxID=914151 RepID=A0ABW3KJY3_9GAMM